jgi:UDP-glucose 4-epimerase
MKQILVIGGNGFIGRPVVEALRKANRRVLVVDINEPKNPISGADLIQGDYGDRSFLKKILKGVDEIILLANSSVPKTSFDNPFLDISENIPRAITLFEMARSFPIQKLVFVSSGGAVYGQTGSRPITEDQPTNPISSYGIAKLAIEKYALILNQDRPVVIVRPANAYGIGQVPFVGQGLIATAVASILSGQSITLYGPETIRDYIYVTDVASGIVAALVSGQAGSVYNLGSGQGLSNLQIVSELEPYAKKAGLPVKMTTKPARPFDVAVSILNSQKLRQDTGWKPNLSFKQGLDLVWQDSISQGEQ